MRRMTAAAGALTAIGALLLAAFAFGATKRYDGDDLDPRCDQIAGPGPACTLSFDAKVKHGKVKSVGDFVFKRIPISCDEGSFVVSNTQVPVNGMKVNRKRKFKGRWNGPNQQQITVKGRFSRDWKTARGTLVDVGDFPPTASNCETGRDKWKAGR